MTDPNLGGPIQKAITACIYRHSFHFHSIWAKKKTLAQSTALMIERQRLHCIWASHQQYCLADHQLHCMHELLRSFRSDGLIDTVADARTYS
jgi:hypothetical protein